MFYVSRAVDRTHFGVIDTEDGKEDIFSSAELMKISETIDIDGVGSEYICPVKPLKETVSILRHNDLHLALSTMSMNNERIGIRVKSKPTSGEICFVDHKVINICRRDVNDFCVDTGSSKSYQSGLTLDDVFRFFSAYKGWTIEAVNIGGF